MAGWSLTKHFYSWFQSQNTGSVIAYMYMEELRMGKLVQTGIGSKILNLLQQVYKDINAELN